MPIFKKILVARKAPIIKKVGLLTFYKREENALIKPPIKT